MLTIGIDPGLRCCGVVVLKDDGPVLAHWTFEDDGATGSMLQRARALAVRVRGRVAQFWAVDAQPGAWVEDAAYNRQYQSESVAYVRQALYDELTRERTVAFLRQVSIQEAKRALAGVGNAQKAEMVKMARRLFGVPAPDVAKFRAEAIADALGVALAGLARVKKERIGEVPSMR